MRNRIKITVCVFSAAFIIAAFVSYRTVALHRGEIDYSLITIGKPPLYAKVYAMASDGGTAWYKGVGYSVYDVHSSHEEDGIWGYMVGPRIRYYRLVFGGNNRESLHFRADTNENP